MYILVCMTFIRVLQTRILKLDIAKTVSILPLIKNTIIVTLSTIINPSYLDLSVGHTIYN